MERCDSLRASSFCACGLLRSFAFPGVLVSFFFERFSLVIDKGMAHVRLTVKDISKGAGSGEEKDHVSEEKDLSNVDADLPN